MCIMNVDRRAPRSPGRPFLQAGRGSSPANRTPDKPGQCWIRCEKRPQHGAGAIFHQMPCAALASDGNYQNTPMTFCSVPSCEKAVKAEWLSDIEAALGRFGKSMTIMTSANELNLQDRRCKNAFLSSTRGQGRTQRWRKM